METEEKITKEELIEKLRKALKNSIPFAADMNFTCFCNSFSELVEELLKKTRREAVEEAFKAIEIEKSEHQAVSEYYSGYNKAIDEINRKKEEILSGKLN